MTGTPASKTVVMVVDDEFLVRMLIVDSLIDAGFDVIEAMNADEAIKLLDQYPQVSVLFTDINMPGSLDGLELARRVHEARPNVQIILTSGRIRPDASMTPPGGTFIEKPYASDDIVRLITTVDKRG